MGMKSFESWFNDMADSVVDPYAKVADKDNPSANTEFSNGELKEMSPKQFRGILKDRVCATAIHQYDASGYLLKKIPIALNDNTTNLELKTPSIIFINQNGEKWWFYRGFTYTRECLFSILVRDHDTIKLEYPDGSWVEVQYEEERKDWAANWCTKSIICRFIDDYVQGFSIKQLIEWIYHEIKE